jgi:hypothetical protein
MVTEDSFGEILSYLDFIIDVAEKQASVGELGNLANEIGSHYRALGISCFLLFADIEALGQGFTQSAVIRRHFLQRTAEEGAPAMPARRSSFLDPFFDALAVNRRALAVGIADWSPKEWWEDFEYEEDYAYASFLFQIAREDHSGERLQPILDQFEAAVEGAADSRLAICKAINIRDPEGFEDSFLKLIVEFDAENEEIADPHSDSIKKQNFTFEPNRFIFVEGLALLRLAEWLGIPTAMDYKYCPQELRINDFGPFDQGSWPYIGVDG